MTQAELLLATLITVSFVLGFIAGNYQDEAEQGEPKYCPNCGKDNPFLRNRKHCSECGHEKHSK